VNFLSVVERFLSPLIVPKDTRKADAQSVSSFNRCDSGQAWNVLELAEVAQPIRLFFGNVPLGHISIRASWELIVPKRNVVFVVDDDPGTLKGVKRLLREHGYDSVLFQSAEAFRNHDDFDQALCIILDINLNNESGIEVRRRLKATGVSVPVIYITASDSDTVRMAATESGCLAYLTKPFSAKSLIEPIDRASAGLA
jgi:CheY-like chemotaxis protein